MKLIVKPLLGVALFGTGIGMAQAAIQPYYNPTNPASPTGFTIGYELYRTIGCPGKQLLDKPCPVPADAAPAAPAPTAEPAAAAPAAAPAAEPAAASASAAAPASASAAAAAPVLTKEHPLVLKGVNFAFDSAKLLSAARATLDQAAADLKAQNYPHVQIDGYTDWTGTEAYNLKLSDRRAASVKKYLIEKGVPADTLMTKGYGETHFVATNKTREGRAENRRVELHVAP